MDGLLIAEQVGRLATRLPAARGAWRFPDDRTAVLPLDGSATLWLASRPPEPRLELKGDGRAPSVAGDASFETGAEPRGGAQPRTPFQAQLAARATGDLIAAEQFALDRVVRLSFGEGAGFVPDRPIDLIVELTGRNANLILVDPSGRIVGAARTVPAAQNRYREVRAGAMYVPPPPYDKIDPRAASLSELAASLHGRPLRDVRKTVDGIGARLYEALVALLAPVDESEPLTGAVLERVASVIKGIAAAPSAALVSAGTAPGAEDSGARARELSLAMLRTSVAAKLVTRRRTAEKRLADARSASTAGEGYDDLRAEADLLLARAAAFQPEGDRVELIGFDGRPLRLTIDPALDAAGNAAQRYDRARRREARAANARQRLPGLEDDLQALDERMASLADADLATLREIDGSLTGDGQGAAGQVPQRGRGKAKPPPPGIRFVDPRGFEVLVGRSAKENEAITFGVAKSRDVWLHVQGYQGAHVLVRSKGRELPFDTVLFAARLAAGFSRAKDSDNVPVDYTERKNVWRVKGGAPGAVHIAHQKTVYVTPARGDAAASGSGH